MENASKALIIAGAILISILLISIGIILINSGKDITSTGTAGMQNQKIQIFNKNSHVLCKDRVCIMLWLSNRAKINARKNIIAM